MKRLFSLLLAIVLSLGLIPTAFAASDEATEAADTLYELGLFSGTGVDANGNPIYDLDRTPTRHEAVTMLVAMLGKAEEAKNGTWETPFTDVADWAKPYVGYAYANGLTSGTSANTYGGTQLITASQYLTFVLTALGYKNGEDFQWDKAWELSDILGMTDGRYSENINTFSRGDVVIISSNALNTTIKDSDETLFDVLNERGFGQVYASLAVYGGSRFYKINGENYSSKLSRFMCETAPKGKDCYFTLENIMVILAIMTGSVDVQPTSNEFLSGTMDLDLVDYSEQGGKDIYKYKNYTYKIWFEHSSLTTAVPCVELTYRGKSLTLKDASTLPAQKVYFQNGIKCITTEESQYSDYYRLDDILQYLGINRTLSVIKEDSTWMFTVEN